MLRRWRKRLGRDINVNSKKHDVIETDAWETRTFIRESLYLSSNLGDAPTSASLPLCPEPHPTNEASSSSSDVPMVLTKPDGYTRICCLCNQEDGRWHRESDKHKKYLVWWNRAAPEEKSAWVRHTTKHW